MEKTIVYHVSNVKHKTIKSCLLVNNNMDKCLQNYSQYSTVELAKLAASRVSLFVGEITIDHIRQLKSSGFKKYGMDTVYIYKIDLADNASNIDELALFSTPEEIDFMDKNWSKYTGEAKSNEEFIIAKRKYMEALDKEMQKCKCSDVWITVDEYLNLPNILEYKKIDKFVAQNLKYGNLSQYASRIPHVQATLNSPLKIVSVEKYSV